MAENTTVVEGVHHLAVEVAHPADPWSTRMVAVTTMDFEGRVGA